MSQLTEVELHALSIDRYERVATDSAVPSIKALAERLRTTLDGRIAWHVDSTAAGGGIQDQIEHEHNGQLDDPEDPGAFAKAIDRLLKDRDEAHRLGAATHERVRECHLEARSLQDLLELIVELSEPDQNSPDRYTTGPR